MPSNRDFRSGETPHLRTNHPLPTSGARENPCPHSTLVNLANFAKAKVNSLTRQNIAEKDQSGIFELESSDNFPPLNIGTLEVSEFLLSIFSPNGVQWRIQSTVGHNRTNQRHCKYSITKTGLVQQNLCDSILSIYCEAHGRADQGFIGSHRGGDVMEWRQTTFTEDAPSSIFQIGVFTIPRDREEKS